MASQRGSSPTGPMEKSTVIDVDVHLGGAIDYEDVTAYMNEPHQSRLVNHSGPSPLPWSGWDRNSGGKIDSDPHTIADADELDQRLCGEFGVDYPILNPMSWVPRLPETDFAVELARGYNQVLLDDYLDRHDHFYGTVTVPTQDPQRAAEEIDRIGGEDQIVGIYIATGGPDRPLGDPDYDVIYQAAQDNDLAVVYHGHVDAFLTDFPRQNQGLEEYVSVNALGHPWTQMLTMTSLMEQGTPEKFPDLDFVFLEAGLLWVPYMAYRLNKEHNMQPNASPLLEKSPEEYVRDRFYFGTQPLEEPLDASHMKQIFDLVGRDSILFASDFPHWDFDNPSTLGKTLTKNLDDKGVETVLNKNARQVFGIGS
ncbi:amidohydrolase family protein [Natrinema sp. CBA1119]|uniref:amidohydrolase family protein n=1 Tax=Natrinema sp. CBA1119 TaxID=1608465 RepID=UPI001C3F2967|nr:amidohydrolase family protein [Natrinema sp. CBA1119]